MPAQPLHGWMMKVWSQGWAGEISISIWYIHIFPCFIEFQCETSPNFCDDFLADKSCGNTDSCSSWNDCAHPPSEGQQEQQFPLAAGGHPAPLPHRTGTAAPWPAGPCDSSSMSLIHHSPTYHTALVQPQCHEHWAGKEILQETNCNQINQGNYHTQRHSWKN